MVRKSAAATPSTINSADYTCWLNNRRRSFHNGNVTLWRQWDFEIEGLSILGVLCTWSSVDKVPWVSGPRTDRALVAEKDALT